MQLFLPLQDFASVPSVYPLLQEHLKEPWLFVQVWLQPQLSEAHSLTSKTKVWEEEIIQKFTLEKLPHLQHVRKYFFHFK